MLFFSATFSFANINMLEKSLGESVSGGQSIFQELDVSFNEASKY